MESRVTTIVKHATSPHDDLWRSVGGGRVPIFFFLIRIRRLTRGQSKYKQNVTDQKADFQTGVLFWDNLSWDNGLNYYFLIISTESSTLFVSARKNVDYCTFMRFVGHAKEEGCCFSPTYSKFCAFLYANRRLREQFLNVHCVELSHARFQHANL